MSAAAPTERTPTTDPTHEGDSTMQTAGDRIRLASAMVGRVGRIARPDGLESPDCTVVRFVIDPHRGDVAGLMVVPVGKPGAEPRLAPLEAFRLNDGPTPDPEPAPAQNRADPYMAGYHIAGLLASSGLGDDAAVKFHDILIDVAAGVADALKDAAGATEPPE